MKRAVVFGIMTGLLLAVNGPAQAAKHIYRWVKDRSVSSDQVLKPSLASRVVATTESNALNMVRKVMTEDLSLSLAEYHKTKHIQDAETTADTVLPEEVVRQQEVELVDEDNNNFRFYLQVKLRAFGGRTRVTAKASPMYRIRDLEAEDEANPGPSGTNVHISSEPGAAVALTAFVEPLDGLPLEYQLEPLPDAAERAAKIVRSFMYLLDRRMAGKTPEAPGQVPAVEPAPASQAPAGEQAAAAKPSSDEASVIVQPDGTVKASTWTDGKTPTR